MSTFLRTLTSIVLFCFTAPLFAAPSIGPGLAEQVQANPLGTTPVIITYHEAPDAADLGALSMLGISGGVVLNQLPMVQTAVTPSQFAALKADPDVRSLYANETFELMMNESRRFIGVDDLRTDRELILYNNGVPVSGKDVGVAYIDTGIDATHPDLQLGENVVQNVFFPLAEVPEEPPVGFVPPVFLEDQPISDLEGGHGTFGAGNVAGTGAASGGFYEGMAPGARLIGLVAGNDAGLSTFAITQAYDYALTHQFQYNIRVANNSFGSDLGDASNYDPNDPINVGTREMHDRFITVVYAAGNSGDVPGAINRLSVAPWVISVAAGQKNGLGTPAGFSSRGIDNGTGTDTAGQPADPNAAPNLRPDLTAPGVDINSTRSKGPGVTNLAGTALGQDLDIAPAFLPFYTTSQGTSFAAPHVSGVVAMMLEVNPNLTPDEIVTLLRGTTTPMVPFTERVVGAGYVDAHNAVRAAAGLTAVEHPADLTHTPGLLTDVPDDQLGTTAQDILGGSFALDAASNELVYRLELADLSEVTPNMLWNQSSVFDGITVFVSTSVEETGEVVFEYGTIAPDPDTGVNTQTTIGAASSGAVDGNTLEVRLALGLINDAVGFDVLGTTATAPEADAQLLIGTSLSGGLLLNSDNAAGTDFVVGGEDGDDDGSDPDPDPDPDPEPDPDPAPEVCGTDGEFTERFADAVTSARNSIEISFAFESACDHLDSMLTWHPGNQDLTLELLDDQGALIATADQANGKKLTVDFLEAGDYRYRVTGHGLSRNADFVVKSRQEAE